MHALGKDYYSPGYQVGNLGNERESVEHHHALLSGAKCSMLFLVNRKIWPLLHNSEKSFVTWGYLHVRRKIHFMVGGVKRQ